MKSCTAHFMATTHHRVFMYRNRYASVEFVFLLDEHGAFCCCQAVASFICILLQFFFVAEQHRVVMMLHGPRHGNGSGVGGNKGDGFWAVEKST